MPNPTKYVRDLSDLPIEERNEVITDLEGALEDPERDDELVSLLDPAVERDLIVWDL